MASSQHSFFLKLEQSGRTHQQQVLVKEQIWLHHGEYIVINPGTESIVPEYVNKTFE